MNWLLQIHTTHAVAHAIGVLALVCLAGMMLGSVKVGGIGLGTAGVLFAGILTGYFGKPVDHATLAFASNISHSDAPMVSYATVYPLTMVLRILSAQILVLLLCG